MRNFHYYIELMVTLIVLNISYLQNEMQNF